MNILAIIPARDGSKGIKNKNIRNFNGRPLLAYTIKQAKQSPLLTRIIVSTDSEKIASVAKACGAEVPYLRPKALARQTSLVADAVLHLLDILKRMENYSPDCIMLLQPTSPLRTTVDIETSIQIFKKSGADAIVSVCEVESAVFYKGKNGCLISANPSIVSTNRQENKKLYKLDGSAIYLIKTNIFRRYQSFMAGKLFGYEIDRWRAVDIDEPQDFVLGELINKNLRVLKKKISDFK